MNAPGRDPDSVWDAAQQLIAANADPATDDALNRLLAEQRDAEQAAWAAQEARYAALEPEGGWESIQAAAARNGHTGPAKTRPGPEPEPTGWEPADIGALLDGTAPDDQPTLYRRDDGQHILYPAKLHFFNGEPESMKTWAALHAAKQEINQGHEVWYFDFEDTARTIVARLTAIGTHRHHLRECFRYFHPDRPLDPPALAVLRHQSRQARPHLAVIDGVTEAMAAFGLDLMSNMDIARFIAALPRRLANAGAAVILIDHVVKDRETRGRWAIGGQHKMAGCDVSITFEVVAPAGRGLHGIARLVVHKDRPGWLRQHAAGRVLAELHLASADDLLAVTLKAPGSAITDAGFRPTRLMEKISKVLEHSPALTSKALRAAVGGQNDTDAYQLAIEILAAEHFIVVTRQGAARYHAHLAAYRIPTGDEPDTEDEPDF